MTVWAFLHLGPRRWVNVERRVRVRVHQPRPDVPRVAPAKCPRCPMRNPWWTPLLPRCRWCGDTGVWTEWRTQLPGRPVQHAVQ